MIPGAHYSGCDWLIWLVGIVVPDIPLMPTDHGIRWWPFVPIRPHSVDYDGDYDCSDRWCLKVLAEELPLFWLLTDLLTVENYGGILWRIPTVFILRFDRYCWWCYSLEISYSRWWSPFWLRYSSVDGIPVAHSDTFPVESILCRLTITTYHWFYILLSRFCSIPITDRPTLMRADSCCWNLGWPFFPFDRYRLSIQLPPPFRYIDSFVNSIPFGIVEGRASWYWWLFCSVFVDRWPKLKMIDYIGTDTFVCSGLISVFCWPLLLIQIDHWPLLHLPFEWEAD